MAYTTILAPADLAPHLADPAVAVVDCSFDLADTGRGEQLYRAAHIPGAVYAHLDRDLSGPKTGTNGRHPLPDMEQFRARLGQWGIGPGVQVVAYDQTTGMWASRLWWLLHYLGHTAAAVLDGGLARWQAEGRPTRSGEEARAPARFVGAPRAEMLAEVEAVERLHTDPAHRLIDSRAPERYRGEVEPLDPVAGHIPGAANLYNLSNLNPDGTFLPPEQLRAKFLRVLDGAPASRSITYCGSGVAAAHNLLAMEIAGLAGGKLYAGSWSEWCALPARPVAASDPNSI